MYPFPSGSADILWPVVSAAWDVLRETGFSSLVYFLLASLWPQPMYHLHSSHTKLTPSFHASQPLYSQSFYQGSSPQALGCTMNPLDILGLPSPATSPLSPPGRTLPRCFLLGSISPPHPTPPRIISAFYGPRPVLSPLHAALKLIPTTLWHRHYNTPILQMKKPRHREVN